MRRGRPLAGHASPRTVWRKSSYSQPTQSDCVEVARVGAANGVRDSKDPEGGVLRLDRQTFSGLLDEIKRGKYGP
ncbi:DUF397 domain-containing protein [Spirillospora sp. NPDC029432]|uniref:DUF397 domain-containing protein n=1 Tax=Spirillospora sp. NPDC029432 TaxID=3154599 RepID=UPI0034524EB2